MLAEYLEKIKSRNNVTILKAALYARYSSDMQRGESVDAQIRLIKEFAEKNNIVIVKQYVDEAKSAKWDSRESFQQMIKDSKTSEWQVVIVHKLDRFARNRDDSTMYRIQLRRYRKYLISAVEQLGDSPEDQLLEAMIEAMAEFYSKNLARETIKGLTENALKGKHCGGIPPLGYELDEFNFYKVNEFEAQGVKLIYSLFLEGKSYTEIIAEINSLGYRTKRNRLFTRNSLYEIFRNEKYTGTFIYNKMESRDEFSGVRSRHKYKPENEIIKVENMIPEIISKEDWKSVQTILNRRKKAYTNHAKEEYLLSGKIKCGECGGNYVGKRTFNSRGVKYVSYICNRKRNPNYKCSNSCIKRDWIEEKVIKVVKDFIRKFNEAYFDEIQHKYIEEMQDKKQKEVKVLQNELNRINADIERIVEAIAKAPLESLIEKLQVLENQKNGLKENINKIQQVPDFEVTIQEMKSLIKKAEKMLEENSVPFKELIDLVVKEIVVNRDNIQIYMCFDKKFIQER